MPVTMKDGADTITYCRCTTCKRDADGQGPGLVWVWNNRNKKKKWVRGWPIGTTRD